MLKLRSVGIRDYRVLEGRQHIGRIRFADERMPGVWLWSVTIHLPGGLPMGTSKDLDTAKADFKVAWEALKARTTPEQIAAAYRAMKSATTVDSRGSRDHSYSLLPIRRGIGRERSARPASRNLLRHLARQFVRPRRLAGFTHRRRRFRVWVAWRDSRRRLGRRAWRCRRDFGRFDRHLHHHLAILADVRIRRCPTIGVDLAVWITRRRQTYAETVTIVPIQLS